jgi:hypothetical protein
MSSAKKKIPQFSLVWLICMIPRMGMLYKQKNSERLYPKDIVKYKEQLPNER